MKKILRLFGIGSGVRKDIPVGLRGSGATGGKGLSNKFFNQAILESQVDHVINTETKVKETDPTEGTAYVDLTDGVIRDKDDVAVTILDGDRIHWVEFGTLTADIDLSAVDDILHSTESGEILDLGTKNLILGTGHSGFINATSSPTDETEGNISAVDSPELVVNNNRTEKLVNLESKNLILDVASTTTGTAIGDSVRLLDVNNNALLINDLNVIFDITTDLNAGSEKASTWYQEWIGVDFLGNVQRILAPDITGSADSTTAGSLEDSTADFVTDAVQIGDIVRNRTDNTQTTVSAVTDLNTLALDDDIFVSGEDYEINIKTPQFDVGKVFKGRVGKIYNNSGSNFEKVEKHGIARVTTAFWHTLNGYGSTNNKIQKFTTEEIASDDVVVTVKNIAGPSADDGFSVTGNMHCALDISYISSFNAADVFAGISKNSTQLTTAIQSITGSHRVSLGGSVSANRALLNSWPGVLSVGEVARPHTDGTADGTAAYGAIHIRATEII